ncbi:TIGR02757 family protein [Sphingobacterium sp. lm-10]|uniref:TIGR02757 family protein n=1 Tax=Sphingobacterium sp. lm-10 TaxID=2944904 RepID=UPI002020C548|nr:TIGR02757 family protein [Sphingobacterium sp. lm-10]MCL7987592.1 TIGR02757 family protein [Sphingobacterium sp. lm-10]
MAHFDLKEFLDQKVAEYNRPGFIESDPIAIPHRFTLKQDVEIMGLFASILAWGQRKTIINKCTELIARMQGEPYAFVLHHSDQDLAGLLGFKHRTFNDTDLLYFISFLRHHYAQHDSLEMAFIWGQEEQAEVSVEQALNYFKSYFFSLLDYPERTRKHISSPVQKSSCKRLNMFLRWMVRQDEQGVDFGIWSKIRPANLVCPCDVHVERVGKKLGLITTPTVNWNMAMELTRQLRLLDAQDPVKYDFALFGLGVEGRL